MLADDARLKEIEKKIAFYQLLSIPLMIMIGLGLYALYGADGEPIFEILNNKIFVYSMIAFGVVGEIKNFSKLLPLWREKAILEDRG
ncbi:MAG: hypothetical protein AAF431_12455 [Pseudomonadota bacterium]